MADPFDFFKSSKRSEVAELESELNHLKVERRMEALKKVNYSNLIQSLGNCNDDNWERCFWFILPRSQMC